MIKLSLFRRVLFDFACIWQQVRHSSYSFNELNLTHLHKSLILKLIDLSHHRTIKAKKNVPLNHIRACNANSLSNRLKFCQTHIRFLSWFHLCLRILFVNVAEYRPVFFYQSIVLFDKILLKSPFN